MSLLLYVILFFTAPVIAKFYDKNILILLIRVVGSVIIIHAFSIVQGIRILKELKFRELAIINCISASCSLIIAVMFAINGCGLWSLVYQQISMALCSSILMFCYIRFIPSVTFSVKSFKEQFAFGINLMLSNLLKTITSNITSNIMAKIATLNLTGCFVQSNKLTEGAHQMATLIVDRSVFPVFARIDNLSEIKQAYISLTKNMLSVVFPLCVLLAFLSKTVIVILLGNQWLDAAWMLKVLSFSLIPCIVQMLCRNILKSRGNTNQIFVNEIIKSALLILSIIVGAFVSIEYILWGLVVSQSITSLWIIYSVSKEIQYSYWQHLCNILMPLIISILSYFFTLLFMKIININNHVLYCLLGTTSIISFTLILSFFFRQRDIFNLIKKLISQIHK